MRNKALIVACVVLVAATAFGALGDVVASWPSPNTDPCAVAASNNHIYVCTVGGGGMIYTLNITNGSVVRSFAAVKGTDTRGLAYVSGDHLWQGQQTSTAYFYDTNANTGSINRSFRSVSHYNRSLAPLCTGDGGTGTTALLSSHYFAYRLYKVDINTGSIIGSWCSIPRMYDIAYDWRSQLVWGGMWSTVVYGCNITTGSTVATFKSPANYPYSMAYNGQYLYVATTAAAPTQIWKVHCPQISEAVNPASVGRVKALFR